MLSLIGDQYEDTGSGYGGIARQDDADPQWSPNLALASVLTTSTTFGQFADTVISYNSGAGFASGFTLRVPRAPR